VCVCVCAYTDSLIYNYQVVKLYSTLQKVLKSGVLTMFTSREFQSRKNIPAKRTYNSAWEARFTWLEYSKDHQGAFCMK